MGLIKYLLVCFFLVSTSAVLAANSFVIQGRLLDSSNNPITTTTSFTVQIRSPGTENCLLYQESQTVDLSTTNGAFALTIGAGTRVAASVDGGNSLSTVFSNSSAISLTSASTPCANSDTSYTPASTDVRKLAISFDDGTGVDTLPVISMGWVPQSLYAQDAAKLAGIAAVQFLKVASGTTPTTLTSGQYTELMSLIGGSSSLYCKTDGSNSQTYTGTATASSIVANSVTTVPVQQITGNGLTSGSLLSLQSNSTNAINGNTGLDVAVSGVNANSGVTRTGVSSVVSASGTGSKNIAAYFSATGGDSNVALATGAGNVGIGTTTPSYLLDVNGDINFAAGSWLRTGGTQILRRSGSNTQLRGFTGIDFIINAGSTASAVLDSSGRFGIGTTSPGASLDVVGSGRIYNTSGTSAMLVEAGSTYGAYLRLKSASQFRAIAGLNSSGQNTWLIGQNGLADDVIGFYNGSANTERMRIASDGKIGVGTTAPAYELDVAGSIRATNQLIAGSMQLQTAVSDLYSSSGATSTPPGTALGITNSSATDSTAALLNMRARSSGSTYQNAYIGALSNSGSTYSPHMIFGVSSGASSYTEKMRLTSDGYLGIGTTNPEAKLTIAGDYSSGSKPADLSLDTQKWFNFGHESGYGWIGWFTNSNGTNFINTHATVKASVLRTTSSGGFSFFTSNTNAGLGAASSMTEKMTIDPSGNVGIGIIPNSGSTVRLDVNGRIRGSTYLTTGGNAASFVAYGGGSTYGLFFPTTDVIALSTASTERLRVTEAGNVGIGNTAPSSLLQVGNSSVVGSTVKVTGTGNLAYQLDHTAGRVMAFMNDGSNAYIKNNTDSAGEFIVRNTSNVNVIRASFAAPANSLFIASDGKLGVGTATPSEMLEVAGTVKATIFDNTSDRRLKKDIHGLGLSLNQILKLRPVSYYFKNQESPRLQYGFIAQEVEQIYPSIVSTDPKSGLKAMNYSGLISPLIKAVQELYQNILTQSEEMASLKSEVDELKQQNKLLLESLCEKDPTLKACR